jgi:hypothetical protein
MRGGCSTFIDTSFFYGKDKTSDFSTRLHPRPCSSQTIPDLLRMREGEKSPMPGYVTSISGVNHSVKIHARNARIHTHQICSGKLTHVNVP